ATEDSLLVETLRQHYPYEFGLVDALDSDVELTRMGYSYVFRYVEGPGELVKDLLKYSKEQGVTDYVTIKWRNDASAVKTIPITDKVFKFYIKHLRSGTTFLGTEWDADISWQEALINHINSFKHEVGVQ
ncbi:MAG: hypothetical protein OEX02_18700, partial [Cyclobacteriaceae bacterium]|nr:hypothetical protein [Cyclobacteriaceae bacterium]